MTPDRMKRHARQPGPSGRLLWVGDEADWRVMRERPRPLLLCPQAGCQEALHAVRNSRGTRFLRRSSPSGGAAGRDCGHWWVSRGQTGPESARHLWMKARLAAICLHLGWAAVPEDPVTFADVWVPDAQLALEVQLRRTDTLRRTKARLDAGAAAVVWFIASDVAAAKTLFSAPAVRFEVARQGAARGEAKPWEDGLPGAMLFVYATVWRWDGWRLVTGAMSAYSFLADVLAGRTGWCPPGFPGLPVGRGGWIRWSDLSLAAGDPDRPGVQWQGEAAAATSHWLDTQLAARSHRKATP